jgi:hypothetical protein
MKLLLNGKKRNIYFRKNNTAYYKSKGNEIDITSFFKKKGGLKKQYINLLVEKKQGGGVDDDDDDNPTIISFDSEKIFSKAIRIITSNLGTTKTSSKMWNTETIKATYKKLIYICLMCKIQYNINKTLFKQKYLDNLKPNITLKIKTILSILNNDKFKIYIDNPDSFNTTRFKINTDTCGQKYIEVSINQEYTLNPNGNIVRLNDNILKIENNHYEIFINELEFGTINDLLVKIDNFNLDSELNNNYMKALEVNNAKESDLDLLKIIMINEGLFKELDIELTKEEIEANDPKMCIFSTFRAKLKKKYLEMFNNNTTLLNNINDENKTLIEKLKANLTNDFLLKERFTKLFETTTNDISELTEQTLKLLYTAEYNNENTSRNLNAKNYDAKIKNLIGQVLISTSTTDHKIKETIIKKLEDLQINTIIKASDNKIYLLSSFNDLIDFYINEIEQTIGRILTTYLSIRNEKNTNGITTVTKEADKRTSVIFGGQKYTGFNEIFGKINDNKITKTDSNEDKFTKMKSLFNKLATSELAILVFGYGYSGSGKTYTLFGKRDKKESVDGIAIQAINHLINTYNSTVTIEAIYELYNETYNILNAISDDRNPYDPLTKGSVIYDYIPNIDVKDGKLNSLLKLDSFYNPTKIYEKAKYTPRQPKKTTENPSNSIYVYSMNNDNVEITKALSFDEFKSSKKQFTTSNISQDFITIYDKIEKYRISNNRIMPTANNSSSSRGHLFIDLKIETIKEGKTVISYLTICDMGGRENPNDLLLGTKIYSIFDQEPVKRNFIQTVDKPHIISKDEKSMYTFITPGDTTIGEIKIQDTYNGNPTELRKKLDSIIKTNIRKRDDSYPGILQLYKNFYTAPNLVEFFYLNVVTDFKLYQMIGTIGNYKNIQGMFCNSSGQKSDVNDKMVEFYKNFFKCIKQGFYINDSINQLLEKFECNIRYNQPDLKFIINKTTDKCDINKLTLIKYIPNKTLKSQSSRKRAIIKGFNKYGWYVNSLPKNCINSDVYKGNDKIRNAKIYKNSYFQYDPIKRSDASATDKKNIGISDLYGSFGTTDSITRKYVVIGCIRNEEKFDDDDIMTLKFLNTVSTSRLTKDINTPNSQIMPIAPSSFAYVDDGIVDEIGIEYDEKEDYSYIDEETNKNKKLKAEKKLGEEPFEED